MTAGGPPFAPALLHELHCELERLLAAGQPPAIAVLLQQRLLRAAIDSGPAAWSGYGVPVALSFASRIPSASLEGLAPEELEAIEETLEHCRSLEMLPWPGSARWPEHSETALQAVREARARAGALLEGEAPRAPAPDHVEIPVPVVAEIHSGTPVHPFFAGIRTGLILRLRVEAQVVFRDSEQPALTVEGETARESLEGFHQALLHLKEVPVPGAPRPGRCWFRLRWEPSGARIVGRSANLPFLLAVGAARSSLAPGLSSGRIVPGIAMTGDLDGARIVPVDSGSLALKVRACFFSHVRGLVVPWEQRDAALEEVRRLEQTHSGRQLIVRGAREVSELWRDPAVLGSRGRRAGEAIRVSLRRAAASRVFAATLLALFVLAAGLAAHEAWLSRAIAASARWEGETLVIRNPWDRVCTRILPPGGPYTGTVVLPPTSTSSSLRVLDLNGDGRNEVLCIRWAPNRETTFLEALDVHGRLLWSRASCNILPGLEPGPDITWRCFADAGRDRNGTLRLLALRRSTQHSRSYLDLLRADSGSEIGILENDGHIETVMNPDCDRDGKPDLCLGGTLNGESAGLFVVLDPDRMDLPEPGAEPSSVTDPRVLGRGIAVALRIPSDTLMAAGRPTVTEAVDDEGVLRINAKTGAYRLFNIYVAFTAGAPSGCSWTMCDGYKQELRERCGRRYTDGDFTRECERLARETCVQTPRGWQPIGNPLDAPGAATKDGVKGGYRADRDAARVRAATARTADLTPGP